jgi:peptidoglycan/xylan/chitin deacetylase (PgdA/CDA1 family)
MRLGAFISAVAIVASLHAPLKAQEVPVYDIPETNPVYFFHRIGDPQEQFTISPEQLREHLDCLRENGYGLVTFKEYMTQEFSAIEGKRPAVLTFDDAWLSQFRYRGSTIDPDSAIGILESYKQQYPDFRVTATFFVSTAPSRNPAWHDAVFGQRGKEALKLEYLIGNGYEIGAHGYDHESMRGMTPGQVRENLECFLTVMDRYLPGYPIESFAYPYGFYPSPEGDAVVKEFFSYSAGVWGIPAPLGRQWRVQRIEITPDNHLDACPPKILDEPVLEPVPGSSSQLPFREKPF